MNCTSVEQENIPTNYVGNSTNINPGNLTCESEIRADVVIAKEKSIRLWGVIKDCDGNIVEHALVKLVEVTESGCGCIFKGIAHTISDCQGFYQFDLCPQNPCAIYKVVVGFANTGSEKEICMNNCNPCSEEKCKPCCPESITPCSQDNSGSYKKLPAPCKCSSDNRF